MSRKSVFMTLAVLVWLTAWAFAQPPHPLDFFPHHVGDIWEYVDYLGDVSQNRILSDSLGSDGNYYLETTLFGPMIVDTTNYYVYRHFNFVPNGQLMLWYKLDATVGETWIVYIHSSTGVEVAARVIDEYQGAIFSVPVIIKVIGYYEVWGIDSLFVVAHTIASGFGLVLEEPDVGGFTLFLRGAIIDSVRYGTVTAIEDRRNSPQLPQTVTLHQNYPNPFNPSTTIRYELPNASFVELTVFDLLGKQVKTLVHQQQPAGSYQITFDASELPGGVYIYRLKTQHATLQKKMILLK